MIGIPLIERSENADSSRIGKKMAFVQAVNSSVGRVECGVENYFTMSTWICCRYIYSTPYRFIPPERKKYSCGQLYTSAFTRMMPGFVWDAV